MIAHILALAAAMAPAPAAGAEQGGASLPDSPGVEIVRSRCLACHQSDLIEQQRLSEAAWTREVAKMERWGAPVRDEQRGALVTYLVRHFGPRPRHAPPTAAVAVERLARGEAILQRACRQCHGMDLVEQQRLSHTAWMREVDKMIRWGAVLDPGERETLADYLAARWGPGR
jgi:cytochrome c5